MAPTPPRRICDTAGSEQHEVWGLALGSARGGHWDGRCLRKDHRLSRGLTCLPQRGMHAELGETLGCQAERLL